MSTEENLGMTARQVFTDYLARLRQHENAELESLCKAYPDFSAQLREWQANWPLLTAGNTRPISIRIQDRFGTDDPAVTIETEDQPPSGSADEVISRLASHTAPSTRYRIKGELARGGMGVILRVWDTDLRRHLAMKVILGSGESITGGTPEVDPSSVGRFLEEAQVTSQLNHPGVVPVHELGLDEDGRVYFTMRLVKGRELMKVFRMAREEEAGWNVPRALSTLLKVCEAVAYAHDKGVIHRDLKPSNVMVGDYGEVYVMDWGLARVEGAADRHDLRPKPEQASTLTKIRTDRKDLREGGVDSPLITMDGTIVGTPAYMPPEQARGDVSSVDRRSDVYSVGALLYELLTGRVPYVPPGARVSPHTILLNVIEGPPRRVAELADVPPELEAICEKAMAREMDARYEDTGAFAEDLRAYLDGRVVRAYESGAWAQAKKWVQRNRSIAASLAVASLAVLGGLGGTSLVQARANASLQQKNAALEGASRFLRDVFRSASPWEGGREVRVASVLDDAALRVETEIANEPLVRAAVHGSIATSYEGLGLYDEALAEYRLARQNVVGVRGEDAAEVLELDAHVAEALVERGDAPEAASVAERALQRARVSLGEDHDVTILLLAARARTLRARDEQVEAERAYRALCVTAERRFGPNDQRTLKYREGLALSLWNQNRYDEAQDELTYVLDRRIEQHGDRHPDTLMTRDHRAALLGERGHFEEAHAALLETIDVQRELFGPDHPRCLAARGRMALQLERWDRLDEARTIYTELVDTWTRLRGTDDVATLRARGDLAWIYRRKNEPIEAQVRYRALIADLERTGRTHTLFAAQVQNNLAQVTTQLGEKRRLIEAAFEIRRELLPAHHSEVLESTSDFAGVLQWQGELEKAEELYRQSLQGYQELFGESHRDTLILRSNLGYVLLLQGKLDEAERIYREIIPTARESLGETHQTVCRLASNLAEILWKKSAPDTETWMRAAIACREANEDAQDPMRYEQNVLATFLMDESRDAEALPILREVYSVRRAYFREPAEVSLRAQVQLATCLRRLAMPVEAEPLLLEAVDLRLGEYYGPGHSGTIHAQAALATLLFERGQVDEAALLCAEALAVVQQPGGVEVALVRAVAARCRAASGERSEAASELAAAAAVLDSKLREGHYYRREVAAWLDEVQDQ